MSTSFSKKLLLWLRSNFWTVLFVSLLLTISLFVSFKNYTSGTFLLGWDNLVPELNFKLNIARSFSSVWQEYQGLGLLGGMAHAADLPREIVLFVFSVFVPISFLRYLWTFLMLLIGPLGIFFLVSKGVVGKSGFLAGLCGFVSSIFYIFNLATLQTFYTPFETFVSFYGFFPWLLFFALSYLKGGKKSDILKFIVVSILGVSSFYVQTLFIVFAIFLTVFGVETVAREGKEGVKKSFKLGVVTLCINAFWLLPVLYFTLTSGWVPGASHINSIASVETQLMNLARNDFESVVSLKGYWFDYFDWIGGKYDYLYRDWVNHLSNGNLRYILLGLFAISGVGIVYSSLKKKVSFAYSFIILGLISFFMLLGKGISIIPLLNEAFRNAFTKWSNAFCLVVSVGIGVFVFSVSSWIRSWFKYFVGIVISLVVIGGSIYTTFPFFEGKLISRTMRVEVPSYYLDTINYFRSQDRTKRIANFPITDFWGWGFYDWGYRGSGFLWYGIEQPILSRTFDVWSYRNEAFYNEISHALIIQDEKELGYVLDKYDVDYILFDGSVIQPGDTNFEANIEKQRTFLSSSPFIKKEAEFGKVTIFGVGKSDASTMFLKAPKHNLEGTGYLIRGYEGDKIIESFDVGQGYEDSKNCNLDGKGSAVKNRMEGEVFYGAYGGGISCDYFYYPDLEASRAYEMRIKGENLQGRSLKFYLFDVVTKNVIATELLPKGEFERAYTILPTRLPEASSGGEMEKGLTLNVETKSFGEEFSENIVSKIEFIPLAFEKRFEGEEETNRLQIISIKKYGTWGYKIDVQGYGAIQLSQGYDNGWIGFVKNSGMAKKLDHFMINSWANGWVVPPPLAGVGLSTVYIFYLPQLLEWGGMVVGISCLLVFLASKRGRWNSL